MFKLMSVGSARNAFALVACALCSIGLVACAPRSARPASSDEQRTHAVAVVDAQPLSTAVSDGADPSGAPPLEATPPPQPRLAWVNPARCAKPCNYDPHASLVRVDKLGVPDAKGTHLVERSAQEPLRALVTAAHAAGHKVKIESAYRSYDDQKRVFEETKQVGRAARPGHSEHQLGTAIDLRLPTKNAVDWLAAHATDHGFTLSYPDGKHRITGYRPENWHVRFVGQPVADELRSSGMILEELFRARPELGESGTCDDCPQPASRGACGALTAAGRCDGTVLQWCYDGALASVDCAAFKHTCGRAKGAAGHDCIAR